MKIIKLSNKNFKLFKEFCEEWIDDRNELIDSMVEYYVESEEYEKAAVINQRINYLKKKL